MDRLLPRGEVIVRAGDTDDRLFIVRSGLVGLLTTHRHAASPLIHTLIGRWGSLGETSLLGGQELVHHREAAEALTPVRLLEVRPEELAPAAHEELVRLGARLLADKVRLQEARALFLRSAPAPQRAAACLCLISHLMYEPGLPSCDLSASLTQEQMAQFIGVSRVHLNKILAKFAKKSWVELDHRGLRILDERAVNELATARAARLFSPAELVQIRQRHRGLLVAALVQAGICPEKRAGDAAEGPLLSRRRVYVHKGGAQHLRTSLPG
jgi:CRP-like cAMP-binding protein